jgi:hypothetical protein
MRSIIILTTIFLVQFILGNVGLAESYDDCRTSCADDKAMRVADCPSPYDSSSGEEDRKQCLNRSQELYNSCLESCPPPPEPENGTPATSY